MSMEFRTLHSHHQRPIPDGFRRCWAVVPPTAIEALLREERFAPPHMMSSFHVSAKLSSMHIPTVGATTKHGAGVDRLATVVNQDGLEAAVWLHASSSIEVDAGWLDHILTAFLSWLMPEDRLLRLHADLFREVALADSRHSIRRSSTPKQGGFSQRSGRILARFPPISPIGLFRIAGSGWSHLGAHLRRCLVARGRIRSPRQR